MALYNRKRTPELDAGFLEALAETGNVTLSAKLAGVALRTVYDWREEDKDFADQWEDAISEARANIEEEIRRRAMIGVDEPVYQGGKLAGHIRRYSDTLLIFLAKATMPEKYRERGNEAAISAAGGEVRIRFTTGDEE